MRKQYFLWTYTVLALILTIYGGYAVINSLNRGNNFPVLGLIMLIIGGLMLIVLLILYLIDLHNKNNKKDEPATEVKKEEEPVAEEKVEPAPVKEERAAPKVSKKYSDEVVYERVSSPSIYDAETIYVKKVGYGPVLRVEGNRILDMRNNTYYTIDNNIVKQNGSGPVYEISGNSIKLAFGSYLFELSGSNINKVYGGFFASISGNYIQTYDLIEKYEMTGSLNRKQILAVTALLFGGY